MISTIYDWLKRPIETFLPQSEVLDQPTLSTISAFKVYNITHRVTPLRLLNWVQEVEYLHTPSYLTSDIIFI